MHKHHEKHRRTSLISVVASSCIVALYEEIYYRQQAHFLLHIHGFFIMVAAVSQIYYQPRRPEKVEMSKQELDTLCCILRQMRSKYGGSDMVLNKILWLQAEVGKDRQLNPATSEFVPLPDDSPGFSLRNPEGGLRELFPFPGALCSNRGLLDVNINTDTENDDLLPWGAEMVPWEIDETFFTDMFGMDLDTFNLTYVTGKPANTTTE